MSALLFSTRATTADQPLYSPYRSADVARGAQAVNRSSVASLAFLVWDILITVDDEVNLIWPRAWSYTKFVYYISRYLPVLIQISLLFVGTELTPHFHFTPHDCYIWQLYQGVAASMVVAIVDTVLILRVHALYHGHRIVRRVVAVCYVLELVGIAVGLGLSLPGITFDDLCVVVGVPHALIIYGASSIIFQFTLFGFTLYKFVEAARSGWGDVPLIGLLMRDGTWAFFLLFIVYLGQLCLYATPNPAFAGVLYCWLLTAFSFSGYRILLNLNRLAENTAGAENRNTRRTDTAIQFSTQMFNSERQTYAHYETYELSESSSGSNGGDKSRGRGRRGRSSRGRYDSDEYYNDSRTGNRTFDTSQISELSLGK